MPNTFARTLAFVVAVIAWITPGALPAFAAPEGSDTGSGNRIILVAPTRKENRQTIFTQDGAEVESLDLDVNTKFIIELRSFNKLLYEVRTEVLEIGDALNLLTPRTTGNPFAPGVPLSIADDAESLAGYNRYRILRRFDSLAADLVELLVVEEEQFISQARPSPSEPNQTVRYQPTPQQREERVLSDSKVLVTKLLTDAGMSPGDAVIASTTIVTAGTNFFNANKPDKLKALVEKNDGKITPKQREEALTFLNAFVEQSYKTKLENAGTLFDQVKELKFVVESEYQTKATAGTGVRITIRPREELAGQPLDATRLGRYDSPLIAVNRPPAARNLHWAVFASGIRDRSYVVRNQRIQRRGAEDAIGVAIGTLYHFPLSEMWAASVGVGTNAQQLQYYGGLSLRLGRTSPAWVTLGATVGQVQRLDGVEIGDTTNLTTVPTKSVYRPSWFLSISIR